MHHDHQPKDEGQAAQDGHGERDQTCQFKAIHMSSGPTYGRGRHNNGERGSVALIEPQVQLCRSWHYRAASLLATPQRSGQQAKNCLRQFWHQLDLQLLY